MIGTPSAGGRLLLLAGTAETAVPRSLFAGWDVMEADSLAHARFLQQFDPFDVVLVDHAQGTEGDRDNLSCLALPAWTSLIVLSDAGEPPETSPSQEGQGPQHWLPRRPALENPSLLAVVLSQAAQVSKLQRHLQQLEQTLQTSRCQADRLVELLWQGLPAEGRTLWLTQRRVLERLGEEVARQPALRRSAVRRSGGTGRRLAATGAWRTDRLGGPANQREQAALRRGRAVRAERLSAALARDYGRGGERLPPAAAVAPGKAGGNAGRRENSAARPLGRRQLLVRQRHGSESSQPGRGAADKRGARGRGEGRGFGPYL